MLDAVTLSPEAREALEELSHFAPGDIAPPVPFAIAEELIQVGLAHEDAAGGTAITDLGRLWMRDNPR